jgi:hypothetical protein
MKKGAHLWIGLGLLLIFQTLLILRIQVVTAYFYSLIWWPYILTVDGLVFRRQGRSLLVDRPRTFLWLIPWSAAIWLVFEGFNLVLKNWYYVGLPEETAVRWPGYFLAFGTVLPGLLETKDLLSAWGIFEKIRWAPLSVRPSWNRPLIMAGTLCLILPLLFPLFAFPLVWLGFVFLLEPFNLHTGRDSLLRELGEGKPDNLLQLLLSGMICGLLWEFWNYWAAAKWIYTVPWVGQIKLFEMPVLGFFGFPPFAVEYYVLAHFLRLLDPWKKKKKRGWAFLPLWLLYFGLLFFAIDLFTVRSFGARP